MSKVVTALATVVLLLSSTVQAKDEVLTLPLGDLLKSDKAKSALHNVPVYFAGQSHPKVASTWGEVSTSRKTNAVGKSDQEACEWVLLSALKVLQEAAQKRGYDAVVNIRSNYRHNEFSSAKEFQCGSGNIIAGVALKGDLVKF